MNLRRLALTLLATLVVLPAMGATIADRSPFTQGLWWKSDRPGHGFDIFNVGTETMVLWYTYDASGRAIWYSAQGTLGAASWPLQKHRWTGGRLSSSETVGNLALKIRAPESLELSFTLDGQVGSWLVEPFRLAGGAPEVDHSGTYFDPTTSGWGLSFLQQGDILGGILYTYDASGAPTWYAGFERGSQGTIPVYRTQGSCPTCPSVATTPVSSGSIGVNRTAEWSLTFSNQLAAPTAGNASGHGARMLQLSRPASLRPADRSLANFASNLALKSFLDAAMLEISARSYAGSDFSPAPPTGAATAFSTTNLQEAGVDEADVVKTDGARIFTFAANSNGERLPTLRIASVANNGGAVSIQGTVPLASGDISYTSGGLYLRTGQLVAVTGTAAEGYFPLGMWCVSGAWVDGKTAIEIFDTSATGLPVSSWRANIDGYLVSSRRIGDRLYVVARYVPAVTGFNYGATSTTALTQNRNLLAATPLATLLPGISVNGGARESLVDAASFFVPPQGTRPVSADMVVVYAIDLAQKRLAQSIAILGTSETVYVSADNLYLATSRYNYRTPAGSLLPEPSFYTTEIHQVRLGTGAMSVVGTGVVEGMISRTSVDKAAFRLSEHQGRLRVVTSGPRLWGTNSPNRLTILEPSASAPGILKTVSHLPNASRTEPLGKPGEVLYGTRFAGDRLYAVTFKSIDPLYVVDLANASDPKITGALEMPGFSEYLHPLPNGLLLGFGKEAIPDETTGDGSFAWFQGLRLSLFDVSGGTPREMQSVVMGKRGSNSALMNEHRAFSSLAKPDGTLAIAFPARIHDGAPNGGSGPSASYPWAQSGVMRFELRGGTPQNAELVQRPMMVTERAVPGQTQSWLDPATSQGRSILFGDNTIFVGRGRFWHFDAAGQMQGPL